MTEDQLGTFALIAGSITIFWLTLVVIALILRFKMPKLFLYFVLLHGALLFLLVLNSTNNFIPISVSLSDYFRITTIVGILLPFPLALTFILRVTNRDIVGRESLGEVFK